MNFGEKFMKVNKNEVFQSTRDFLVTCKKQYEKEYLPLTQKANLGHRIVSRFVNGANKALTALIGSVVLLAIAFFDIASFPIRYMAKQQELKNYFSKDELKDLSTAEKYRLWDKMTSIINDKNLQISKNKIAEAKEIALVSYARSAKFFKPVALLWVDFLLKKASQEKKKLVFLARDGSAPRKLAMSLLKEHPERYPNIKAEDMPLAYFSRKVILDCEARGAQGKKDINDYMQQLGVKPGTNCIFVDIGFQGSMIKNIKDMLDGYPIEFEYLISHTSKAHGFFGTHLEDLKSVQVGGAGGNAAIHWLEDSHQGAILSPSKLIRNEKGVFPNTRTSTDKINYLNNPANTSVKARSDSHIQYLIRRLSKDAIAKINRFTPKLEEIEKDQAFVALDNFLLKIKNGKLPLYVNHE
jgi:hypothetical protein